jgi:hypothetical protein
MSPPGEFGQTTRYAFWLITDDEHLVNYVQNLLFIAQIDEHTDARLLVDIHDAYDPDEIWHCIRSDLERESQIIILDKIWEDALWLL